MNPSGITPEIRLTGPLLLFIGGAISFIGLAINLKIALAQYRTGQSSPSERPLY